MRTRERPPRGISESRAARGSGTSRTLNSVIAGVVVVGILGLGAFTPQGDDVVDGAASALTEAPSTDGGALASVTTDPRTIPVVEESESTAAAEPVGTQSTVRLLPVEEEMETETDTSDSQAQDTAGESAPIIVSVDEIPEGHPTTLSAGGDTVTVATVSGTGSIALGFTRSSSSTAPNLPTYVSTICDGISVYSGAFNTTTQGPVLQDVPFSGSSCSIKVKVAQPSAKWRGTSSAVVVTRDEAEVQGGTPYVEKAGWTTTAVDGADSFSIDAPEGFTGTVSVKLTACSSKGGTSDDTKKFACGDMVEKGVGSEGTVTVTDGEQVLAETGFDISAETHHDMVTVDVDEPATDDLTIEVQKTDGSAVLVHGPGTSAVGTH